MTDEPKVEAPKTSKMAVEPNVEWNCAINAVLILLHQRDERGPAGERAGIQDILNAVRSLRK